MEEKQRIVHSFKLFVDSFYILVESISDFVPDGTNFSVAI